MSFIDNRELAMMLWLGIAVAVILAWEPARVSAKALANAALEKKLVSIQICFLAYCLIVVFYISTKLSFEMRHYWVASLWILISGLGSVFSTISDSTVLKTTMLRKWLINVFSTTALIEIMIGLRSFHWIIEFVLLPIVVLLLYLINSRGSNFITELSLIIYRNILATIGLILLMYSLFSIIASPEAYVSGSFLVEITLPALLSLLCIPFLYVLFLVVCYEASITRLPNYLKQQGLNNYAITSSMLAFAWDVESLNSWVTLLHIEEPNSKAAIQQTISKIYQRTKLRRRVYKLKGDGSWRPSDAELYLSEMGLPTNKYNEDQFDKTAWHAYSTYALIGDDPLQNAIVYYIYGDEFAARKLYLKLNVQVPSKFPAAWAQFKVYCLELSKRALTDSAFGLVQENISSEQPFEIVTNSHTIKMIRELWEHNTVGGFEMVLTITPNAYSIVASASTHNGSLKPTL